MAKTHDDWKVLPHGRLTAVDDDILTVVGEIPMPLGTLERRMTLVRLVDGRLVVFSAIALAEDAMRELEAFGTPGFLVVPNARHRMDAKAWKRRYPSLQVVAPEGAREAVGKIVAVDATAADFADPRVVFRTVPGTRHAESALEVAGAGGSTLVLNDIVGNVRNARGAFGFFLRLMRFAGDEPRVPLPVRLAMVGDKRALAAAFRRWAELPVKRILVSHGEVIDRDPQGVLRRLAGSLA